MSKKKDAPMEGQVTRAVDFNLRKEDLMLLILEGRKEIMEEQIAVLQNKSTVLQKQLAEANDKIKTKVKSLVLKSLNPAARKLAQSFAKTDLENETDLEKFFKVEMQTSAHGVDFTQYKSVPISGTGGAFIKTQNLVSIKVQYFTQIVVSISFSLQGKVFANKSSLFYNKEAVRPCAEYSKEFVILQDVLCSDYQKSLPEFKAAEKIAQDLAQNESLLSDIIAEYDLFNRNQPRAKAKMIKEVLSRDEAGQDLLDNIYSAAKGVKLLAEPAK